MKRTLFLGIFALHGILLAGAHGQERRAVPLMRPEEAETVQRLAIQFIDAVRPSVARAAPSTVWVWADNGTGLRSVAYGTVIGDGTRVLTKWSEVALATGRVQVVDGNGASAVADVIGVYQEDDLALLQLREHRFPALQFTTDEAPKLGRFLVAASPDDTPVSVGVVAVEARSLREQDQGFLGVLAEAAEGGGLRIETVEEGTAAAEAGLKKGDILLSIGGRAVTSVIELRTTLARYRPGDPVEIDYSRGGVDSSTTATLKGRNQNFPEFPNGRLRTMERMGAKEKSLSVVRSGFPSVIQTDLRVGSEQCGGPVVDLDGNPVGIAIARADRTRSFVIPAAHVAMLLSRDPVSPEVAQNAMEEERAARRQIGRNEQRPQRVPRAIPAPPGAAENLRKHLQEMDTLIERMNTEMGSIGE